MPDKDLYGCLWYVLVGLFLSNCTTYNAQATRNAEAFFCKSERLRAIFSLQATATQWHRSMLFVFFLASLTFKMEYTVE
jgi:hypothetical protein